MGAIRRSARTKALNASNVYEAARRSVRLEQSEPGRGTEEITEVLGDWGDV